MRLIILIGLLLFCSSVIAEKSIPWQYKSKSDLNSNFAPSLVTAKRWAAEYFKNKSIIIRFEYSIKEKPIGYEVQILAVYKGESVAVDGEMCVHTDKKHKYVKAKQCMAP